MTKIKTPQYRFQNQKYLTCDVKRCPGIKIIFLCAVAIIYTRTLQIAEFFQNKEANYSD